MEKAEQAAEEKKEALTLKEIEKIIIELAEQGMSAEKIGLVLRDKYNVPRLKLHGKRISQVLKENKMPSQPDLSNLTKKVEKLEKHISKNKQDHTASRIVGIKKSKISKLRKYLDKKKK